MRPAFLALILASCGRPAAPDECVLYAACVEDAGRPDAAEIAAAYGTEGSCWSQPADAREACERRCEAAVFDDVVQGQKDIDDVQSGVTTLFEQSHDYRLTYALTIDGGDC